VRAIAAQTARTAVPFAVVLVLLTLLLQAVGSGTDLRVGTDFLIATVMVIGLQVFSGNAGIVSFGHVAFMGVGAYVAALVSIAPATKQLQLAGLPEFLFNAELPFLAAMAVATTVSALVALLLGFALTRMRPDAMAMATIALMLIFFTVTNNWTGVTNGSTGVFGVPQGTTIWVAVAFAIAALVLALAFRYARVGLIVRASREDDLAAAALGGNVRVGRLLAWTVSGALVGAGGALWAQYHEAFSPEAFYFTQMFALLSMLVVGGMSTVSGAVVGAAVVTLITELIRRAEAGADVVSLHVKLPGGFSALLIGLLLLVILRWRPGGLVSGRELGERRALVPRWARSLGGSAEGRG